MHRNWLAITHSLPTSEWYYEATSEWTLDYPPFFAWFERALAILAEKVDPMMLTVRRRRRLRLRLLKSQLIVNPHGASSCVRCGRAAAAWRVQISELPYRSVATVIFQRTTVLGGDALLFVALLFYLSRGACNRCQRLVILGAVAFSPALIYVDNVHFQYNNVCFALLIASIAFVEDGRFVAGALCYTVLVNFKHLFVYLGPLYLVALLRHACFDQNKAFRLGPFVQLAGTVVGVCAASLAPFVAHLPAVAGRLFPFGRGLCHAYWAANVWALYNVADKIVAALCAKTDACGSAYMSGKASFTGGLVGTQMHAVLPTVTPLACALLVLGSSSLALKRAWEATTLRHCFGMLVANSALCAFMFGFHVHEKQMLIVVVPLTLRMCDSELMARTCWLCSLICHWSLFPLLFQPVGPACL